MEIIGVLAKIKEVETIPTKYKINKELLIKWFLYIPIILPIAIITGIIDGLKKTIKQAQKDILV